ncbi:MAG: hypothetical protein HC799_06770 [Limnothrix sp. RL_2_0]|nr:hypothetical protein [Limnothrix sp. RL_2_0]
MDFPQSRSHRTVYDVLEEVIQEMLQRDRYLKQELQWIQTCTPHRHLQEAFLCTSLEEYCLRPIQNQPLISYRFVNLMRRYQRSGMTQLPADHNIRLLSTELENTLGEQTLNLLDDEAIARHQTKEDLLQQQLLRQEVLDSFITYLQHNVKDPLVIPWLQLYLQGKTQEAIAPNSTSRSVKFIAYETKLNTTPSITSPSKPTPISWPNGSKPPSTNTNSALPNPNGKNYKTNSPQPNNKSSLNFNNKFPFRARQRS